MTKLDGTSVNAGEPKEPARFLPRLSGAVRGCQLGCVLAAVGVVLHGPCGPHPIASVLLAPGLQCVRHWGNPVDRVGIRYSGGVLGTARLPVGCRPPPGVPVVSASSGPLAL